ncbi:MAG: substrate-binding domain-containing protein [Anaerolineales bacterium]|nr:substrate-binding domain-containing protein [Anaerolineales bacterium]
MHSRYKVFLTTLLFLASLIQGCSTEAVVTEQPVIHQVAVTPAVTELASAWLTTYIKDTELTGIDLRPLANPYGQEAVEQGETELLLCACLPPSGWFATPLAEDAAAVIVHPDNPLRDLTIESIQDLFSGTIENWQDLDGADEVVQVVLLLENDELRSTFEAALPLDYTPPASAILAPTPAAVVDMVRQTPGAVGYVPFSSIDEQTQQVRIVRISGVRPGPSTLADRSYPMVMEILAIAPEEPIGPVREWLNWIQANTG